MRRARTAGLSLSAALIVALALAAGPAAAVTPADPLIMLGKHLYGQSCVACHGANGEGISRPRRVIGFGPGRAAAVELGAGPPLVGVGALAPDFYIRTGYMPLARVGDQPTRRFHLIFTDREIRALVAYVASLGPGPAIPNPDPSKGNLSEGKQLFTDHCAGCHQVEAQGGLVTGAVPPPLEDATTTQIAEAVRIGPYVMPRFSTRAISDRQLNSIIRYVQQTKNPDDFGGWGIGNIGPVPEGFIAWFFAGTALVVTCIVIGTRFKRREDE